MLWKESSYSYLSYSGWVSKGFCLYKDEMILHGEDEKNHITCTAYGYQPVASHTHTQSLVRVREDILYNSNA